MKYLITTLLMGCLISYGVSQEKAKPQLIYRDGDRSKGIEKIVFTDEQGRQAGEFDVQANNPYRSMINLGVAEIDQRRGTIEINNAKVSDLLQISARHKHQEVVNEDIKYIENTINSIENSNAEIVGVVYSLKLFNSYHKKKAEESVIEILNNKGQSIRKINVGSDVRTPAITDDQTYLGIRYGGIVNHDGYKIFDEGINLYDLRTGDEIFNLVGREDYVLSAPYMFQGMMIFSERNGLQERYFVVKPNERTYYTYDFTYEERQKLKDITHEGLILDEGGSDKLISFESDFTSTKF